MTSSGCSSAITSVQVMTAGVLATWSRQSGHLDRSSIIASLPVRLLEVLEHLALGVDGVHDATEQRRLQGAEGEVVLVVTLHPQLRTGCSGA